MVELVLASASPRRKELLARLDLSGVALRIEPADIDETPAQDEPAADYVRRMARTKATVASGRAGDAWVVAADTIVALEGAILPKPADAAQNAAMIRQLAGREHAVTTAVALARAGVVQELVAPTTAVRFRALEDREAEAYAATGEGLDKAGGYGIQGKGAALVAGIDGSYTNVVGLPLAETLLLLRRWGVVE